MDIRTLRYFLAMVREQNIFRVAEALFITQPTLSRQMAQLEEELGVPLFEHGKRLSLTDAGVALSYRAAYISHGVFHHNLTPHKQTQDSASIVLRRV